MIRRLPLLLGLAFVAAPARAEDFTGFYAGVNAGYGWSREESRGTGHAVPPEALPAKGEAATALPPSASAAASALRRANRSTIAR